MHEPIGGLLAFSERVLERVVLITACSRVERARGVAEALDLGLETGDFPFGVLQALDLFAEADDVEPSPSEGRQKAGRGQHEEERLHRRRRYSVEAPKATADRPQTAVDSAAVSEASSGPSQKHDRRRPHGGRPIRVGLLGAGVVGGGVLALLAQHARQIEQRVGVRVEVARALVRDLGKPRVPEAAGVPFTTDAEELLGDASLDLFVEVMGGPDHAGTLLARALSSGRSVVTANKALLAARGASLFALAAAHRADLAFEAAVGGGIPIIRTLRDAASSDEVVGLTGILNGTSNFILTAMTDSGAPFAAALADAQARGFAEADPSLDVGGFDAAQKLLVLAMLAFGQEPVPLSHDPSSPILVEGITAIDAADVEAADRLGFVVKHLVVGRDHGERVELRAHPALVRKTSAWAAVAGSLNAVKIEGRALGPLFMSGRGAGDLPTAVSVVADVVEVARSIVAGVPGLSTPPRLGGLASTADATGEGATARALASRPLVPRADLELRYYVRFEVHDQPGVLARIAGALAEHRVSIAEIVQSEGKEGRARIVLTTHRAREGAILTSLSELAPISVSPPVLLRIEDAL